MQYQRFLLELEKEAKKLAKALNRAKRIRFISHLDADGLCSASIIVKLLRKYNKEFYLSIVKQLETKEIDKLKTEDYDTFLFTDIGSGQLSLIQKLLPNAQVIILDHHPNEDKIEHKNLLEINPHNYGIDGGSEISASTLCFLLSQKFNVKNIAHLAIIGSIGDTQEKEGELAGVNKEIIKYIDDDDDINIKKGLKVFGRVSKPIHKALTYSTANIPNVSGSEPSAIQFLADLKIDIKDGEKFRTVADLNEEEEKKIITNIIIRRLENSEDQKGVTGNVYMFAKNQGAIRDAHEFSTLLNSCGRQGLQSVGIMVCLGDKNAIGMIDQIAASYRRKILKAINWFRTNRNDSTKIVETEHAIYLKGGDEINDTMIGTLCSIKSSSKDLKKSIIMGFANSDNGVKVSGRVMRGDDLDIGIVIKNAVEHVNGEGGGHGKAGGAKIPFGQEDAFISQIEQTIKHIKGQKVEEN